MVAQGACGMIHFNQPTMKPKSINRTRHNAGSTTVTPVFVHLEQMSSGWHEYREGVLVHGCLGGFCNIFSNGWMLVLFP
tara:strand:- start:2614 stop:2850 length:237 start_codon:yes stop_codon:yes gene_type:complete